MKATRVILCGWFFFGFIACNGGGGGGGSSSPVLPTPAVAIRVEPFLENLAAPVDFSFLPNGNLVFAELVSGLVRLEQGGSVLSEPILSVPVRGGGLEGILGLAVDPDYEQNGYLYIFQTTGEPVRNRLIRYQYLNGSVRDELVLLDNLLASGHAGGKLVFARDKTLFVSIGDGGDPSLAQDMSTLSGKVLRMRRDGAIPGNNPFDESYVYALGFRNVFGMSRHPQSGSLYVSDNGPTCDDELNLVTSGGNYGWRPGQPCGDDESGYVSALTRITPSVGVTGVTFYNGSVFPEFENQLFLADYNTGAIRRFAVDDDLQGQVLETAFLIEGGYGPILDLETGPDGFLYFSTPNAIYRVVRADE